jgi:hypothetical protein
MEEERIELKKEEKKMIEESDYSLGDNFPIDIENKLKDAEIESRKKAIKNRSYN